MNILETTALEKTYGQGEQAVYALRGIDLTVAEGEFVAIVGTSGSGKTTLLQLLSGLEQPDSGEILIRRQRIDQMGREEMTIFRRRNIGFVFQDYNLMPVLNVYENIVLPLKLDGTEPDTEFINGMIRNMHLEELLIRMPDTLSGGQQQRVAIARALAAKPALVLADEPTGNLDTKTGIETAGVLKASAYRYNQTMIVVTHDEEIAQMADRIIRIEDGQIR